MKKIYVVGMGPGDKQSMTLEAVETLEKVDVICSYTMFSAIIQEIYSHKKILDISGLAEKDRCEKAVECANNGETVAIVSGGDASIYAMSSLIYEIVAEKNYTDVEVISVSGITAAISGGNILGSPLTGDFMIISLSDMLTPVDLIRERLKAAGTCNIVAVIYNAFGENRVIDFKEACNILLSYKSPDTICGYVKNIRRYNQEYKITTLKELVNEDVDRFTTIFIGNDGTKIINDKMITHRGYGALNID